jgi:hypothetical protein
MKPVPEPPSAASLSSGGQPLTRRAWAALMKEALGVGRKRSERSRQLDNLGSALLNSDSFETAEE